MALSSWNGAVVVAWCWLSWLCCHGSGFLCAAIVALESNAALLALDNHAAVALLAISGCCHHDGSGSQCCAAVKSRDYVLPSWLTLDNLLLVVVAPLAVG